MPHHATDDPGRYLSHVAACRREEDLFAGLARDMDDEDRTIAGLRRRRRRAVNAADGAIKTVSLIEEDGTLYWRDGIPSEPAARRRRGRRGAGAASDASLVLTREFEALAPNKIVDAVGRIDRRLNQAIGESLQSRLRALSRKSDGSYEFQPRDVAGPFAGRTLLFVHGTFSNAGNLLGELTAEKAGQRLLGRAATGPRKYDRILFFEHPTLSVSPVINALELGRAMARSSGTIDVVAHSRGGLVVRWWLEAFGSSLRAAGAPRVRAVLAGSPLHGTSLAAPDKIQHAMSLVSNVGTFAEKTMGLVGLTNPFIWVAGKLVEVIVSVTGALARTPVVDALTALVPGLAGQSAVSNNHELNRLRSGPCDVDPAYYAILSNFETQNPTWRFWRNFRKDRVSDLAADIVFPGENDLVVDTTSMTDFGVPQMKLAGPACNFRTSDTVWHCNYFRQQRSIDYIADSFGVTLQ